MGKQGKAKRKSINMSSLIRKEQVFSIYSGAAYKPKSPTYYATDDLRSKSRIDPMNIEDSSLDNLSKIQNDNSPIAKSFP